VSMKVYLSGAITKDPNYVIKFKNIENALIKFGFDVVNPVDLCHGITGYAECMKKDIEALLQCDLVCNIEDDIESMGRDIELTVARAVGMPIVFSSVITQYYTPEKVRGVINK